MHTKPPPYLHFNALCPSLLKSDIIYGCSLTLDTEDEVDADIGVEVSEDVEDELLDDFDNEVDTLTLTLGLGSSDSSDSEGGESS